jgi:hypothetical protein
MAGGNFDEILFIFAGRIQWPQGPLTLDPNEVPRYVEAWVVQANTGAAQSFIGTFPPNPPWNRWITNANHYHWGNFQPGPALGTALVWGRIGGLATQFLWTDEVQLR